eukprot:TRINITY_DN35052_c0_g2_i1.p2 TRINITY_DN35052_c0_g2~~TRINITY_DN35052_c0_g2_i1.p2  ORF type:complete len:241 (+),score=80.89 TRINITY_DN35052_c0_g2_i1:52-723(+)
MEDAWGCVVGFFEEFGGVLYEDVKGAWAEGGPLLRCLEAAARLPSCHERAAEALAPADAILEITGREMEEGWKHVCFREAHVVALVARALCRAEDSPLSAMADIDMCIILGAPPPIYSAAADYLEPLSKAAFGSSSVEYRFPESLPDTPASADSLGTMPLGGGQAIVSVPSLTPAEFKRDFYSKEVPVVVSSDGSVAAWPAMQRWQDAGYFQRTAGWRTVPTG